MNLTVMQLKTACSENDYIAVRHSDGDVIGINCGLARIRLMINKPNLVTQYVSFKPIGFMEYISIKNPFMS